jgi:uncharacterized protein (TIGR03435 family)
VTALGNHLWHCTIVVIVAALTALALRPYGARVRFWIWFAASAKFLLPFSLLLSLGAVTSSFRDATHTGDAPPNATVAVRVVQPFGLEEFSILQHPPPPATDRMTVALLAIWASGSALIGLKRYREWQWLRFALRISTDSDIGANIDVRLSSWLVEPSVVGWRRPVLLLPAGIADRLTTAQLNAVLTHEMVHASRKDNLLALVHMLVELLFWFYPAVWWIGARLVTERELACDEEVVQQGIEPRIYAEAILEVCKSYARSPIMAALGVTGGSMRQRIEQIMTNCRSRELDWIRTAALACVGMAIIALPIVTGAIHAPLLIAKPAYFESVTVHACSDLANQRRGAGYHFSAGEIRTGCLPLADEQGLGLIQRAYVRFGSDGGSQWPSIVPITNKPAWFASELYEITGTAHPHTPQATMEGAMLRAALEDRFQLKIREEAVQVPVYELKSEVGRTKLNIPGDTVCTPMPSIFPPPKLPDSRHYCTVKILLQPPAIHAEAVSLPAFAAVLSRLLDRPVIDRTGITDIIGVHVTFKPDAMTPGLLGGRDLAHLLPAPESLPLAQALEQFGLRLEPANGLQKQLVIDHAERPAP